MLTYKALEKPSVRFCVYLPVALLSVSALPAAWRRAQLCEQIHLIFAFHVKMADELNSSTAAAQGTVRPAQPCARQKYRSNAHSQGLLDGLLMLREGGILFDVVLIVEERPIQAHRILLAASCDYFRYA